MGEHISLWICVSQGGGTPITRGMCFPGGDTHINRDMSFPGAKQISLGICVSHVWEHISLGISVSQVGKPISLRRCVSQGGGTPITRDKCFPVRGTVVT